MKITDFKYHLGPENIASEPAEIRLGSRDLGRMFVVDRAFGTFADSSVWHLPRWLNRGEVLVLNISKRIPGVLRARTEQGGQVELRFSELTDDSSGICRIYPLHGVTVGTRLVVPCGSHLEVTRVGIPPHRLCGVRSSEAATIREILKATGLPITSFFSRGFWDVDNYNPVYSLEEGAVESPMAGVHFTHRLLDRIRDKGVSICFLTLHAVGSWLPFVEEHIEDHIATVEPYRVPPETAIAVNEARQRGHRIVAVGSTVFRALETAVADNGTVRAGSGRSSLFIRPGYDAKIVDAFFTNFHPSRSSLMVLDAAFCPFDVLMNAYVTARERGYLFHEFGDAIFYQ